MGEHLHRPRFFLQTAPLDADTLQLVLDSLPQPDVLRVAHVCAQWRRVARRHTNYYCSLRLGRGDFSRTRFFDAIKDAMTSSDRVPISLEVSCESWKDKDAHARLQQELFSAIKLTLERLKKLDISVPDALRASLFEALDQPAPLLDTLRMTLIDPAYSCDSDDDDEEIDEFLNSDKELLPHLFSSSAPRLRSVTLSGVRLGMSPAVAVFRHVTRLELNLNVPTFRLHLHTHFPALLDLAIIFDEWAIPQNAGEGAFALPQTLRTIDIRASGWDIDKIYELHRLETLVSLTDLCIQVSRDRAEYLPYLAPLRASSDVRLRVYYEQTAVLRVDGYYSYKRVLVPTEMRLSLEAGSGLGRTVTFRSNERDDSYDPEADWDDRFDSEFFQPFKFVSYFNRSITSIEITHEFVPFLFQHFKDTALEALTHLEINLDLFRGPFWVTRATEDADDFRDGDKDDLPWPKPAKPVRRVYPGQAVRDYDESVEFVDDDGYTRAENHCIDRGYAHYMLNQFDEEREPHIITCPQLEKVRLRTTYKNTQPVQTRQLAHFGRALGLVGRAPEKKPRLLLRGVQLSCAKRGKLHLEVFKEPVEEPVILLKNREIDDY